SKRRAYRAHVNHNELINASPSLAYLRGEQGRLREAIMGLDGELYVTTSNCDGRGSCPSERDKILRITR
ncbi:MAG: hypothetical protein ACRDEA_10220, partial [Microcystaceae cyanobacterium]